MHIKEELVSNSREQALRIAHYVGGDPARFHELMEIFLSRNRREAQLAAMAAGICFENHPDLVYPYMASLVDALENPVHDAVARCILRTFQFVRIPGPLCGCVWDICFRYLSSAIQPTAIRVFAMTVLSNICMDYPELKSELQSLIEDCFPYGSAGFQSRAKKVLKKLKAL